MKLPISCFTVISLNLFGQDKPTLFNSLFSIMHKRSQFHGSVLIAEHEKIVYSSSFGKSKKENYIPLNQQTLFIDGSESKVFTAIAIQQLLRMIS